MKAYIAHHYWEKSENAHWKHHPKFPSEVLTWLKTHYFNLTGIDREPWTTTPKGLVYLFYNDTQEIHGRNITEMTAIWFVHSTNPEKTYTLLQSKPNLLSPTGALEIDIGNITNPKQRLKNKNKVIFISSILMIILVYLLTKNSSNTTPKQISSTQAPSPSLTSIPKDLKHHNHEQTPSIPVPAFTRNSFTIQEKVCAKFNQQESEPTRYCYQAYIKDRCQKDVNINYDAWLRNLKNQDKFKFKNLNCLHSAKSELNNGDGLVNMPNSEKKIIIKFLLKGN